MKRLGTYWNGIAVCHHMIYDTEAEAKVALALVEIEADEYEYTVVEKYKDGRGYVLATYEKEGDHFLGYI